METIRIILRIFWKNFKKFLGIKPEEYLTEDLEVVRKDFEAALYGSEKREVVLNIYLKLINLSEIKILNTKKLSKKERQHVLFTWIGLCESTEEFDFVESSLLVIRKGYPHHDNNKYSHYDYEAGKYLCLRRFEKAERIKEVLSIKRNFPEIRIHIANHLDRLIRIEIEKIKTSKEAAELKESLDFWLDYNFDDNEKLLLNKWSKLFLEELSALSNEGKKYQNNLIKLLDDMYRLSDYCPPVYEIENIYYEAWDNLASVLINKTKSAKTIKIVYSKIRDFTKIQELALKKWEDLISERIANSKNLFDLSIIINLSPIVLDDFDGAYLNTLTREKWDELSLAKLNKSATPEDLIEVYETSLCSSKSEEEAYGRILTLVSDYI